MNLNGNGLHALAFRRRAMTLVEMMVAMGIGSLVLAVVAMLTLFGARSFVALGNHSVLDQQSRLGVDLMTREIRQATALVGVTISPKGLVFTNAAEGVGGTKLLNTETIQTAMVVLRNQQSN